MLLRCKNDVNAAAETVFACVDEPEHIVKWVGGAVSHTYVTERNPANPVGQRFLQKLRMGNSVNEFNGEIIAWENADAFRPAHSDGGLLQRSTLPNNARRARRSRQSTIPSTSRCTR